MSIRHGLPGDAELGSIYMKSYSSGLGRRLRIHELFYRLEKNHDLLIVVTQLLLKLRDLSGELFMPGKAIAKLNKRPDNKDADLYSSG
jgi:hypothetical protein